MDSRAAPRWAARGVTPGEPWGTGELAQGPRRAMRSWLLRAARAPLIVIVLFGHLLSGVLLQHEQPLDVIHIFDFVVQQQLGQRLVHHALCERAEARLPLHAQSSSSSSAAAAPVDLMVNFSFITRSRWLMA